MKAVLLSLLCLSALSVHLRSSQPQSFSGLDTWIQITEQFLGSLTDFTSGAILQQLYPANYQQVENEWNQCMDQNLESSENYSQSAIDDLFSLVTACSASDPGAVVTQLMQDTLNSMGGVQCTFSVDLFGDLNNFYISALAQGFNLTGPMASAFSPINQATTQQIVTTTAQSLQDYVDAMNSWSDGMESTLGIDESDIDELNTDANQLISDLGDLSDQLAQGSVNQDDVTQMISDSNAVASDFQDQVNDVVGFVAQYLRRGVRQICALSTSLASNLPS